MCNLCLYEMYFNCTISIFISCYLSFVFRRYYQKCYSKIQIEDMVDWLIDLSTLLPFCLNKMLGFPHTNPLFNRTTFWFIMQSQITVIKRVMGLRVTWFDSRGGGGTRYILGWGGAALPLIPWPCLRQKSLIFLPCLGQNSDFLMPSLRHSYNISAGSLSSKNRVMGSCLRKDTLHV